MLLQYCHNMKIGFSTADFYQEKNQLARDLLEQQLSLGSEVIEVNTGASVIRAQMLGLSSSYFDDFKFKTLHAPASIDAAVLSELIRLQDKFNFDYINFHPDQLDIKLLEVLGRSGLPVCVENMDSRKLNFRDVESMEKLLNTYPFGLVLDLNHCYSNGENMDLVNEFWNRLEKRIKYFHLSGFTTLHEPLYKTRQRELVDFVESKDRPVVIESMLADRSEMEQEWHYIVDNMLDR